MADRTETAPGAEPSAATKTAQGIHMLGICGTAMTALAGMLLEQGYRVTGSDDNVYPPMSGHLAALGISLVEGYRAGNIPLDAELVIVGNVIQAVNPEARAMRERGLPFLSMAEAIKRFAIGDRYTVAVAGTHGKTTTTALGAHVLVELGADPGFLIGGIARNFDSNFRLGGGDCFIIEADEYDTAYFDKTPKFFKYHPSTLILTSLEFDHADIYSGLDAIRAHFAALVRGLPSGGLLVACADDPEVRALTELAPCPVVTYGTGPEADCRLRDWRASGHGGVPGSRGTPEDSAAFSTLWQGAAESWEIPLAGEYNALNATAVMIAARHLGYDSGAIGQAFCTFKGVKRRQEVRGEADGIVVLDDFAHHPTAVRLTITAIQARYPGRPVWAVFEPRSFTARSSRFQDDFMEALSGAQRVVLAKPYHSEYSAGMEPLDTKAMARELTAQGTPALAADSTEDVLSYLVAEANCGDVVLIMSNGDFDDLHERLLAALKTRGPEDKS